MAKGYWMVHADIRDQDSYKEYVAANGAAFSKFGARFLVRGGQSQTVSGTARARNVVLEFPSYEAALACWNSPEYQEARAKQRGGVDMDVVVGEGYEGAQPGGA